MSDAPFCTPAANSLFNVSESSPAPLMSEGRDSKEPGPCREGGRTGGISALWAPVTGLSARKDFPMIDRARRKALFALLAVPAALVIVPATAHAEHYPAQLCGDCSFGSRADECSKCGKWRGSAKIPA